jgi:hypothetical protein
MHTLAGATQLLISTADSSLDEMRHKLKGRLADGEFKTLGERFYVGISRLCKQLTHGRVSPGWWVGVLVLTAAHLLLTCLLLSLDGLAVLRAYFLTNALTVGLAQLGLLMYTLFYRGLFAALHDHLVDIMLSPIDLTDLSQWLASVSSTKYALATALPMGILLGPYVISSMIAQLGLGASGAILAGSVDAFAFGLTFFYFALIAILPMRIGQYQVKLYTIKPSSSELVARIANLLSRSVLLLGCYAALFTLLFAYIGISIAVMLVLIFAWTPLIVLFAATQNAMSRLIANAKWRTLNSLQATIEGMQQTVNFGDQTTMETINRLIDYHDRIEATRSSALSVRTSLEFINSLLLPLLAVILANLDKLFLWFR